MVKAARVVGSKKRKEINRNNLIDSHSFLYKLQVAVEHFIFWVELDGLLVVCQGQIQLPLRVVDISATVERVGILRVELDGLLVVCQGQIQLPLRVVGVGIEFGQKPPLSVAARIGIKRILDLI